MIDLTENNEVSSSAVFDDIETAISNRSKNFDKFKIVDYDSAQFLSVDSGEIYCVECETYAVTLTALGRMKVLLSAMPDYDNDINFEQTFIDAMFKAIEKDVYE